MPGLDYKGIGNGNVAVMPGDDAMMLDIDWVSLIPSLLSTEVSPDALTIDVGRMGQDLPSRNQYGCIEHTSVLRLLVAKRSYQIHTRIKFELLSSSFTDLDPQRRVCLKSSTF